MGLDYKPSTIQTSVQARPIITPRTKMSYPTKRFDYEQQTLRVFFIFLKKRVKTVESGREKLVVLSAFAFRICAFHISLSSLLVCKNFHSKLSDFFFWLSSVSFVFPFALACDSRSLPSISDFFFFKGNFTDLLYFVRRSYSEMSISCSYYLIQFEEPLSDSNSCSRMIFLWNSVDFQFVACFSNRKWYSYFINGKFDYSLEIWSGNNVVMAMDESSSLRWCYDLE